MNAHVIMWFIIAVILTIVEGLTYTLVCIWFVVGAICATISAALGMDFMGQLVIFTLVSIIALLVTRPIVEKIRTKKILPDSDRIVGQTAMVIEAIDAIEGTGQIKIGGIPWTARSEDGGRIPTGTLTEVVEIEGVKAIVKVVKE